MTDQPVRKAMSKPEAAGRMVQWAIELSQFDVEYRPRTAIKAQALADFIAELPPPRKQIVLKNSGRYIQMDRLHSMKVELESSSLHLKTMFSNMASSSNSQ